MGDRFVFDDGSAEQVVAVDGEKVTWRRHTGSTFVRYRNVALPNLEWDFRRARGEAEITADPQALWPLEVGKGVSFAERVRSTRKDTGENRKYDRAQHCRVSGKDEVTVPAGTFATLRIVCMPTARSPRARTRKHTLWYAPAVGHYVKEAQDIGGRETSVRQLTQMEYADTPQAIGTSRNLEELLQRTLETRLNGELVQWATPDGRHAVEVVPTATERRADGTFCRRFELKISTAGQDQITRRAACRTAQGWRAVDAG